MVHDMAESKGAGQEDCNQGVRPENISLQDKVNTNHDFLGFPQTDEQSPQASLWQSF